MTRYGSTASVLSIFTSTGTKGYGTDERQYATYTMHDSRTSEVVENMAKTLHHETVSGIVTEPAATPCPVALDRIDEQGNDGTVDNVHRKLSSLSHSTTDNRSGGGTEDSFENQEALNRQTPIVEIQVTPVGHPNKTCTV